MVRVEHKNWIILVSPVGSRWQIYCAPRNGEPINHPKTYRSKASALKAAISFVDCMIARCRIGELLDSWLESNRITRKQYESINRFISWIVKVKFAVGQLQSEADQKQPEQPQQNQHDSLL